MATATKTKPKTPAPAAQKTPQRNAVATTPKAAVPATVLEELDQLSGQGISHDQADNIVPLIYLLQPLSPQAMKGKKEKYIDGAEAGDIWLRNAPTDQSIIKGEQGMVFQPCYFSKCWIEWMPDRGGFVARHDERPSQAELKDEQREDGSPVKVWRMPSGNSVNESREFSGFVLRGDIDELIADGPSGALARAEADALPYTLPLSGSGHTVGKQWMTSMRDDRLPSGKPSPMFGNYWKLSTSLRSKNNNNWYMYDISKVGMVTTADEVARGKALHEAFKSGEKRSDTIDAEAAGGAGEGGEAAATGDDDI